MNKKPIRILYFFPEKKIIMHQWQRIHFINELEHHNITFEIFNPLQFEKIESAWIALLKKIKENKENYNLFFTGIGNAFITPEVIGEIRKLGLPTLLICFDNLHAPFIHKKLAPAFDLVWLTSHETQPVFKKWGANTIFLPYAANPFFFNPSQYSEIESAGFIGTPYGTRITRINQLLANQINVSVYSDVLNQKNIKPSSNVSKKINTTSKIKDTFDQLAFPIGRKIFFSEMKKKFLVPKRNFSLIRTEFLDINSSVSFEEMGLLFSRFAVSLNITDIWNTYLLKNPVFKLHLRTFEIPMCGGLEITSYTDELASYFEEDKEMVFYRSDDEFISKVKFYLKPENFEIRKKIKIAARKKSEAAHTWFNRFNSIFQRFNIT